MPRKAAVLAAAAAAACVAVAACGSVQMGAAAITGGSRISSSALTDEVANLNAAYRADRAKGISPQLPAGQATQQVLTWLITFRIYDQIASQQRIYITPAQVAAQSSKLSTAARQSSVTVPEYVSALAAVPPDLQSQLARYLAIRSVLESRLNGGKAVTTQAEQTKVQPGVTHAQCVASKSLNITVNPQFGEFDYSSYAVVLTPPTLSANQSPAKATAIRRTPPC